MSHGRVATPLAMGIVLYFVLLGLWRTSGASLLYEALVLALSKRLLIVTLHFPLGSSEGVGILEWGNPGHVHVLLVALTLVCVAQPWRYRILHYGTLAAVALTSHALAQAIQLQLGLMLKAEDSWGFALLVPWEQTLLVALYRLLYLTGLQIVSFLALLSTARLLTVDTNPVRTASGPRLVPWAAAGLLVMGFTWIAGQAREMDPRHALAHREMGTRFLTSGRAPEAETQFRASLRGNVHDGETWHNLALAILRQGRPKEAAHTIDRGLKRVSDEHWHEKLAEARALLAPP